MAALEGERARLTEELGKATQAARHSAQQAVKIEGLEKELAHFQVWEVWEVREVWEMWVWCGPSSPAHFVPTNFLCLVKPPSHPCFLTHPTSPSAVWGQHRMSPSPGLGSSHRCCRPLPLAESHGQVQLSSCALERVHLA